MTPEEFQKLKEAEKDHLRKIRELKKVHKQHAQQAKVTRAVTDMATGMNALYDEHREMVDRLQMDTLQSEARMEVALDSVDSAGITEAQDAAELELDSEAIRKAKAQELIRQMKLEAGGGSVAKPASSEEPGRSGEAAKTASPSGSASSGAPSTGRTPLHAAPKPTTSSDLPEKTIGRMKP
jgi:hypothetical protein